MELLERAGPLGALDGLVTASAAGGRIALIAGEAGAGKSALVGAVAAARLPVRPGGGPGLR